MNDTAAVSVGAPGVAAVSIALAVRAGGLAFAQYRAFVLFGGPVGHATQSFPRNGRCWNSLYDVTYLAQCPLITAQRANDAGQFHHGERLTEFGGAHFRFAMQLVAVADSLL